MALQVTQGAVRQAQVAQMCAFSAAATDLPGNGQSLPVGIDSRVQKVLAIHGRSCVKRCT